MTKVQRQYNGENIVFSVIVLELLDIHVQKNCFELHLILNAKINSKSVVGTNVKLKTIRLLEESIRENNRDFELGKMSWTDLKKHNP